MSAQPLCSVLAFYTAGEGDPQAAYQAIRLAGRGKAFLLGSDGGAPNHRIGAHAALRLEGESLLAVAAQWSEVETVVKQIQSTGSPAVFVLHEGPATPLRPHAKHPNQPILSRLDENGAALERAHRDLAGAVRLGHALTAAA